MKILLAVLALSSVLALGCAPTDQAPSDTADTYAPTPDAGGKITDMDFESGEVEEQNAEPEEAEPEVTPNAS